MDQQRPAVADPPAPVADVGPGRPVAVGAVDVQHVDRVGDVAVGGGGERARRGGPGRRRRPRRGWPRTTARSSAASSAKPVDLLRAAVVAGVRVDGDDLDAVGRGRRPARSSSARGSCRSRRSARPAGQRAAAANSRRPWSARHPAVDVGRRAPAPRPRRRSLIATYTPRPNTTTHATPEHLQHAVAGEDLLGRGAAALLEDEQRSAAARSASARSTARRTASRCRPSLGLERPLAVAHQRRAAATRRARCAGSRASSRRASSATAAASSPISRSSA